MPQSQSQFDWFGYSEDAKHVTPQQIAGVLKQYQGRKNAVSVNRIAKELGVHESHGSCPGVRKKIKDTIKDLLLPVGSSSKGYFLIETEKEFQEYEESLNSRIAGILQRLHVVRRAFNLRRGNA